MSCATGPARWQVRLLAAALGALCSAGAGLVTSPSIIGLIFGLVGVPVGAMLGFSYGPELIAVEEPDEVVRLLARLATLLGTVTIALGLAISQSRGASLPETLELGFIATVGFGVVSVPLGYPLALFVSRTAASGTRRLAPMARRLWLPSAFVVALAAAGTVFLVGAELHADGATAAFFARQVAFEYIVRDASPGGHHQLAYTSHLDGGLATVSATGIGACSTGTDQVIGSDWALWITDEDAFWAEAPRGQPLVSSAQFGAADPVQLTISIDAKGRASWHRGLDASVHCNWEDPP